MKTWPILFGYADVRAEFPHQKTFESFLRRALKQGRITQIKKGLYGLNNPSDGSLLASPYQIACRLSPTAFITGHFALAYYGLAEQSFRSDYSVASLTAFRSVTLHGASYRYVPAKDLLGVKDRLKEEGIRVVSKERLMIEGCEKLGRVGGYEELTHAITLCHDLDEAALLALLSARKQNLLFLKVGYLLETYYSSDISEAFLQECLTHRSPKKYYFASKPGFGGYIKKWNLIVPLKKDNGPHELL